MTLRERDVDLADGSLHLVERGAGLPLILLHGITAGARIWDPVAERLARRFRPIALDQRGHGLSATRSGGYDARAYVRDVLGVLDALDIGRAVLVGHSLGSRNVLEAGATGHPAVAGVVAIDFTPFVETAKFDALDRRVSAGDTAFEGPDAVKAYLAGRYPRLPPDAIGRRAEHCYRPGEDGLWRPRAVAAAMADTCAGLRADLAPALRAISVPALLVRGADSAFVSAEAFARARALRPDLGAVTVEGADHYVPEVQPERTAALVESFVDGLGPAGLS